MRLERRPSTALVVASLALLIGLSGTSYATILQVPKGSVGTKHLQRNAVSPSKLAPNAVRTGHVLNGSLLVEDFKPGQIPQGPKGTRGTEESERGLPGLSGYEIVTTTTARQTTTSFDAQVACPGGKARAQRWPGSE